ncbi:hypothetical protein H5410_003160 [Solanum commersonii]|uniref:Uncharacterized protein n=1 Tax=Solanum commersonii TaxID=4109 RepID=A0A9J6B495_SOLCO|nr:hypothetical protein H5410_003160 [Solanum commersonii]
MIHRNLFRGNNSTTQGLQYTEKSSDSISPIERTDEAISGTFAKKSPEKLLQIRPSSHQFHGDLNTRVYSPGEEVHLSVISSRINRPISGDKNSSEQATEKLQGEGGTARGTYSMDEEVHHTNISINIAQEHNQEEIQESLGNLATIRQVEVEELNCRTEAEQQGIFSQDHADPNGLKQNQHSMEQQKIATELNNGDTRTSQDLNDQHGNTNSTSLEVIEVESSSHFLFGVKPTDKRTSIGGQQRAGKAINYTNEVDNDQMQEQQAINNSSPSRNLNGDDTQEGKYSQYNACRDVVSLSSTDNHVNISAKGQKNVVLNNQEQGRGDTEPIQQIDQNHGSVKNNSQAQLPDHGGNSEPNNYHKEFPKISSNFDRHTISN